MRPVILDLFCGCGGAAVGYKRAGFDVVGVDHVKQRHYPYEFVEMDAIRYLEQCSTSFDAIHASPPCQAYSALSRRRADEYQDLVGTTRDYLQAIGLPYVIENVPGAPLVDPVILCGSMFGLGITGRSLRRHRLFECTFQVSTPPCDHSLPAIGAYGGGRWDNTGFGQHRGGYQGSARECAQAMDISWADRNGVNQAVPPAYTEHIGRRLIATLQ